MRAAKSRCGVLLKTSAVVGLLIVFACVLATAMSHAVNYTGEPHRTWIGPPLVDVLYRGRVAILARIERRVALRICASRTKYSACTVLADQLYFRRS